jgi:predicted MFS family arabinose efflux permease
LAVFGVLLLRLGSASLPLLVVGIAALELGVQGSFVAHQTQILALDPTARNRLLTWLVLVSYLGAALSSLLLSVVWSHWQWQGATTMGLSLTLAALLLGLWPSPRPEA